MPKPGCLTSSLENSNQIWCDSMKTMLNPLTEVKIFPCKGRGVEVIHTQHTWQVQKPFRYLEMKNDHLPQSPHYTDTGLWRWVWQHWWRSVASVTNIGVPLWTFWQSGKHAHLPEDIRAIFCHKYCVASTCFNFKVRKIITLLYICCLCSVSLQNQCR